MTLKNAQKYNIFNLIFFLIAVFTSTFILVLISYYFLGYTPFGNSSLASMDADIQYLDLFSYLKDVLNGNNSVIYTFSKGLGGNNIGNYAYYLSSPFNLLVVLFEKENLPLFFNLIFALKISTCAATMTVFAYCRFGNKYNKTKFRYFSIFAISISYALCQYNIAQSSNIM